MHLNFFYGNYGNKKDSIINPLYNKAYSFVYSDSFFFGEKIALNFIFYPEYILSSKKRIRKTVYSDLIVIEFLVFDLDEIKILLSDFFEISIDDIIIPGSGKVIEIIIIKKVEDEDEDEDAVHKLRLSALTIQKNFKVIQDQEDEIIRKFHLSSQVVVKEVKKGERNVFSKYVRFPS